MGLTKFTDARQEKYLELISKGVRRGKAAEAVGVNRHTASNYAKEHPEFLEAIQEAEMQPHYQIEDALFRKAQAGHVTAMIFYLINRMPERWADVKNVRVQGQFQQVSDEDIEKRLEQYAELFAELEAEQRPTKAIEGEVVDDEEAGPEEG